MPVTPETLLGAAQAIGRGKSEVDQRNATSRAYYAAFHAADHLANSLALARLRSVSSHRDLIEALTHPTSPRPAVSIGHMLEQCRLRRNLADYAIDSEFPAGLAQTVLVDCDKILGRARAFLLAQGQQS